jgi:hypothetical protein
MSSGVGGRSRIALPLLTAVALLLPPSAGPQPQSVVQVEMSEFTFRPATIDLSAGRPIRLVLVNHGQIAHQFETEYLRALAVLIVGGTVYAEAAASTLSDWTPVERHGSNSCPAGRGALCSPARSRGTGRPG